MRVELSRLTMRQPVQPSVTPDDESSATFSRRNAGTSSMRSGSRGWLLMLSTNASTSEGRVDIWSGLTSGTGPLPVLRSLRLVSALNSAPELDRLTLYDRFEAGLVRLR